MYKIALMASALLVVSCGGKPVGTAPAKLADSQWVLTGFESKLGVSQSPSGYYTLGFTAANKLEGAAGCFALSGEYTQTDNLLTLKSTAHSNDTSCVSAAEDAQFLEQLNGAKSFTTTEQTLVLNLPDGQRLNFIKKFPGCAKPIAIQNALTSRLEILPKNSPIDDLITQYEKTRPDFVVVSPADNCAKSVVASVNPNTLMELRCDPAVAELIYK
jgi:heat shock protein HslJ